jgi:hypothetical protein
VINEVPLEMRRLAMGGLSQQGLARTLSGMDGLSQQGIAHTLSGGLGDDVPPTTEYMLTSLSNQNKTIIAKLDAQDKARRMAAYVGIASAVFAAFRLGILAFPTVRERIRRSP